VIDGNAGNDVLYAKPARTASTRSTAFRTETG